MQKIIIKNFGPIKQAEIPIRDTLIFIGSQASGKSTIAKLIYFFRSLKDQTPVLLPINKSIRFSDDDFIKRFITFFKEFITNDSFKITYCYTEKDKIILEKATESEIILKKEGKILFPKNSATFIPAGRNIFTAFSDLLLAIDFKVLDNLEITIKEFIKHISLLRRSFRRPITTLIEDACLLEEVYEIGEFPIEVLKNAILAQVIIEQDILKGKYQFQDGFERLYFDEENSISLSAASSGQQEAVWIALVLFNAIFKQEETFLVVEEPEAHLYPYAQKAMVELMALMLNTTNSQLIITTHSPYILSAFNNLVYANNIAKQNQEALENATKNRIGDKRFWLDVHNVGVYLLENNQVTDIIDHELNYIKTEVIDRVSNDMLTDFETLFNLE